MFINSVQSTTQIQAYILNNLQGPLIVLLNALLGLKPLQKEITGLLMAIFGVILILVDPMA